MMQWFRRKSWTEHDSYSLALSERRRGEEQQLMGFQTCGMICGRWMAMSARLVVGIANANQLNVSIKDRMSLCLMRNVGVIEPLVSVNMVCLRMVFYRSCGLCGDWVCFPSWQVVHVICQITWRNDGVREVDIHLSAKPRRHANGAWFCARCSPNAA